MPLFYYLRKQLRLKMSDFIALTGTEGNKIKFNATITIIHMIEGSRGTNVCTADGDFIVKESADEIDKRVAEWNKKQKLYDRCLQCGNGTIPITSPRFASCLKCGMLRDLNLAQQNPCACSKS